MSTFENIENRDEKFREAAAKFENNGPLGVTAEDHKNIGSTPPDELQNNPGKTRAELMDEAQILKWLFEYKTQINEFSKEEYKNNSFAQSILPQLKKELGLSIEYLRNIDKLPEDFR